MKDASGIKDRLYTDLAIPLVNKGTARRRKKNKQKTTELILKEMLNFGEASVCFFVFNTVPL